MGVFNLILADPPWPFRTRSEKGKGRSPERHYACMPIERIKALPVERIAAPNCALLMWCTWPLLPQGLGVIRAWGFEYKTCAFDWAKQTKHGKWHIACGYYTRANTEYCLLATRGRMQRVSASVRQLVVAPVGAHSAKPPEVHDRIVQLFGDLPRVELFARHSAPGWRALGNEIDGMDIEEALLQTSFA